MIGEKSMPANHPLKLTLILVCLSSVFAADGLAQRVYSYVDEHGVRVYTNIPPKNLPPAEVVSTPITPQQVSMDSLKNASSRPANDEYAARPFPGAFEAIPPSYVKPEGIARGQYDSIIEKYADRYRLDPDLVRTMISRESAFNPRAVSNKGAQGLMQLMPATASRLGVRKPEYYQATADGAVAER